LLQFPYCRGIIPPECKGRVSRQEKRGYGIFIRLPREDLTQQRHTKLCNPIPPFATGLPLLYYSYATFENNHILPQYDENNSRLHHRGGCYYLFVKLEFVNLN